MGIDEEAIPDRKSASDNGHDAASVSHNSTAGQVGRENLASFVTPHESYESKHRWDPDATWTAQEEKRLVRKTDLYLLSWICVMVSLLSRLPSICVTKLTLH